MSDRAGETTADRTAARGDGPAQVVSVLLDQHRAGAAGEDIGAGTTIDGERGDAFCPAPS